MGLFSRRGRAEADDDEPLPDDADQRPLVPKSLPMREEDRALLERGRAELADRGVDLGDLQAIGAAHDADLAAWLGLSERRRDDHAGHVERWGVAIGEYLARHTDLRWTTVSDPFGVDLGLMGGDEDFAVIPTNLVSGRWLNGESGWIPRVVGHLVSLRSR